MSLRPERPSRGLPTTSRQNSQGQPLSPASNPALAAEESKAIQDSVPRLPGKSCQSDQDLVEWAQRF